MMRPSPLRKVSSTIDRISATTWNTFIDWFEFLARQPLVDNRTIGRNSANELCVLNPGGSSSRGGGGGGEPAYNGSFACYISGSDPDDGTPLISATFGFVFISPGSVPINVEPVKAQVLSGGQTWLVLELGYHPPYNLFGGVLRVTAEFSWSSLQHDRYEYRVLAELFEIGGSINFRQKWIAGDIYIMGRWW